MRIKLVTTNGSMSFDSKWLLVSSAIFSLILLSSIAFAPTEETIQTTLNATVNVYIDIVPSYAIYPYGIQFGNVDPGTSDNPALNNTGGPGGGTKYNVSVDPTTNVNVDFGNALSATISGLTVKEESSVTNATHGFSTKTTVTTSYTVLGNSTLNCTNVAPGSGCWIKYYLDVSAGTAPGVKQTTYKICGVQTGAGYGACA